MDGFEDQDDIDRGSVWDILFDFVHPVSFNDLKDEAKNSGNMLTLVRLRALTKHPWFNVKGSSVSIAYN